MSMSDSGDEILVVSKEVRTTVMESSSKESIAFIHLGKHGSHRQIGTGGCTAKYGVKLLYGDFKIEALTRIES